jgi:hypothetical protein
MGELLLAAIVGSILTIGGGIGATLFIRSLDHRDTARRGEQELRGAATMVLDEMAANIATLEVTLKYDEWSIPQLRDAVYQDRQVVLVQGLPSDVRAALRDAYIYAQAPRVLRYTVRKITPAVTPSVQVDHEAAAIPHVQACYDKTRLAQRLLEPFATIPATPVEPPFGSIPSEGGAS